MEADNDSSFILLAKLSLENIRGSRTRSDQVGQRISYAEIDCHWPKRRNNQASPSHRPVYHESSVRDTADEGVPHLEADRHPQAFSSASAVFSILKSPTERSAQCEIDQDGIPPSNEVRLVSSQARSAIIGLSSTAKPALSMTLNSLPSRSRTGGVGNQEINASTNEKPPGSRKDDTDQTIAAAQLNQSRGPSIKAEPEPELQADSSVIDPTSDDEQPMNDKNLTRQIEKKALIT